MCLSLPSPATHHRKSHLVVNSSFLISKCCTFFMGNIFSFKNETFYWLSFYIYMRVCVCVCVCVSTCARACVCVWVSTCARACVSVNESCDRFYWCISNVQVGVSHDNCNFVQFEPGYFHHFGFSFVPGTHLPASALGVRLYFPIWEIITWENSDHYPWGEPPDVTNSLDAPSTHSGASLSGSLKIQQKSGFKMGVFLTEKKWF